MEINITSIEDAVDLLSREIRDSGQTFGQIAKETRLNIATVSRLYYKETKRPHYRTVMLLFLHFNYRIFARKSNLPKELPIGVRKLERHHARVSSR